MSKSVNRCYVCGRVVRGVGFVPALSKKERRRFRGLSFCGETCAFNAADIQSYFFAAHGSFARRQFVRIAGDVCRFLGRCRVLFSTSKK